MKKYNFDGMIRGWFVGDFEPSAFKSKECEVALQKFKAGEHEPRHVHKIATEITFIKKGRAMMNNQEFSEGDITVLAPGESSDFKALEDTETIVVKIPSVKGDKYPVELN